MNFKKIIIAGTSVAFILSTGVVAFAENENSNNQTPAVASVKTAQPMVVQIGERGNALLRGSIETIGTTSLTVKSWGGSWTVNVSSTTKFAPRVDMSQFKVGDFVGVQGVVSSTSTWMIDASMVRNWTERKEVKQEIKENKEEIRGSVKGMAPRNWEGVVSEINSDGTFKLKVGSATYDIKMATGAKLVSKGYATIVFSDIKVGDTVRVYGPLDGTTITAVVVRDVMITTYDLKANKK